MLDLNFNFHLPNKISFKCFKRNNKSKNLTMIQDNNLIPKDLKDISKEKLKSLDCCYYLVDYNDLFVYSWYDPLIEQKYNYEEFKKTHLLIDLLPKNKFLLFKSYIKKCKDITKFSYICDLTNMNYIIYFQRVNQNLVLSISFPSGEEDYMFLE